jgi:hypothetical protein
MHALRRQRQVDIRGFEASLVFKLEFQDSQSYTQRNTVSKNHKKKKKKKVALVALAEDLGSIPSSYTAVHKGL